MHINDLIKAILHNCGYESVCLECGDERTQIRDLIIAGKDFKPCFLRRGDPTKYALIVLEVDQYQICRIGIGIPPSTDAEYRKWIKATLELCDIGNPEFDIDAFNRILEAIQQEHRLQQSKFPVGVVANSQKVRLEALEISGV